MQEQPSRPPRPSYRRWAARRRPPADASDVKDRATREAVEILWQALTEAETVLAAAAQEMSGARQAPPAAPSPTADLQDALRSVADYFGRVVDLIGEERRLLSEQVGALGQAVGRLEEQLNSLADALAAIHASPSGTAATRRTARPLPAEKAEPRFAAGGEGVQVAIAPIAGFQDLMDLQRALNAMPTIEGVSVDGYLDGEARLVLHLREAVTAERIAEGVRQATGQDVTVEEARPEALRLRLRLGAAP